MTAGSQAEQSGSLKADADELCLAMNWAVAKERQPVDHIAEVPSRHGFDRLVDYLTGFPTDPNAPVAAAVGCWPVQAMAADALGGSTRWRELGALAWVGGGRR